MLKFKIKFYLLSDKNKEIFYSELIFKNIIKGVWLSILISPWIDSGLFVIDGN